jgi:hypothetical protein
MPNSPAPTRRERQDAIREGIRNSRALEHLVELEDTLRLLMESDATTGAQVAAARALMDSYWRRINKILPDLRAIELTGADGGAVQLSVAQQIALAEQAAGAPADTLVEAHRERDGERD